MEKISQSCWQILQTHISVEDNCGDGYSIKVVRQILPAKDQGLISDRAYNGMRMALPEDICSRIPLLSTIIQERREQNKTVNTILIPQVRAGYSIFLAGRLQALLFSLVHQMRSKKITAQYFFLLQVRRIKKKKGK